MSDAAKYVAVAAAAALVYLGWIFASRYDQNRRLERPARPVTAIPEQHGSELRIVHFYASPGVIARGGKTLLCYGVANAESVRIEPGLEPLAPSANRCLEIAPRQDTTYTLTASGRGATLTQSLVVRVSAAAQAPASPGAGESGGLPRISYFGAAKKQQDRGETIYTLCYRAENAAELTVDPPVVPAMRGAPHGCFYVVPREKTTYTLSATDEQGRKATRSLTLAP